MKRWTGWPYAALIGEISGIEDSILVSSTHRGGLDRDGIVAVLVGGWCFFLVLWSLASYIRLITTNERWMMATLVAFLGPPTCALVYAGASFGYFMAALELISIFAFLLLLEDRPLSQ